MSGGGIAAAVLAAGGSRRLGHPKQLVVWRGRTLLRRAVDAALAAGAAPVLAVLGCEAERCLEEIADLPVHAVIHEGWAEGMAGSIAAAISALGELAPSSSGLLLLPCDQPHLTSELLARMIATFREGASGRDAHALVACGYAGIVGPPALFPAHCLSELAALEGDAGARAVLARHAAELEVIDFPEGALDIDRDADLARLAAAEREPRSP